MSVAYSCSTRLMLHPVEVGGQPGARKLPVAFDGNFRNALLLGSLTLFQATEEA